MAIKQVITILAIVFLTPWFLYTEDEDILPTPLRPDKTCVYRPGYPMPGATLMSGLDIRM